MNYSTACVSYSLSLPAFSSFFFSTSLRTKARRACRDGKQLSGVAVLIPHDDLIPLRMTICFEPRIALGCSFLLATVILVSQLSVASLFPLRYLLRRNFDFIDPDSW